MHIIAWLIIGFIAGLIARALVPGRQSMGIIATTILGIVGSLVGGFLGQLFTGNRAEGFTPAGLIGSIIGAIVVLLILGAIGHRGRRAIA